MGRQWAPFAVTLLFFYVVMRILLISGLLAFRKYSDHNFAHSIFCCDAMLFFLRLPADLTYCNVGISCKSCMGFNISATLKCILLRYSSSFYASVLLFLLWGFCILWDCMHAFKNFPEATLAQSQYAATLLSFLCHQVGCAYFGNACHARILRSHFCSRFFPPRRSQFLQHRLSDPFFLQVFRNESSSDTFRCYALLSFCIVERILPILMKGLDIFLKSSIFDLVFASLLLLSMQSLRSYKTFVSDHSRNLFSRFLIR